MPDEKIVRIGEDATDRTVEEAGVVYVEPDRGADMPATVVERKNASRVTPRQGRAAMNMWIAGATYDEVAERFDYQNAVVARVVIEEALAKAYTPEDAKSMFMKTHARYERLLRGVLPKAEPKIPDTNPDTGEVLKGPDGRTIMIDNPDHIAYVKLAADLVQREAKLHGVEAPVQVQVTPSMEEFHSLVAQVVAKAREDEVEEADIWAEDEEEAVVVE